MPLRFKYSICQKRDETSTLFEFLLSIPRSCDDVELSAEMYRALLENVERRQ